MSESDLTLEKIKIAERLTAVETKFDSLEPMIKDIHAAIVGSNGTVGLKTDVALLKSQSRNNEKHGFVFYSAIVGLIFKAVWEWIKKG